MTLSEKIFDLHLSKFVTADVMDADQPLYAGATITLAGSMILLIAFAMRHSLTGEALADLLVLLELHCLTPNLCQRNLKTFMDFFRSLKVPLQFHYYCQQCFLYHGTRKSDVCPNCNTHAKANSTSYFLVIPIVSQLTSLYAGIKISSLISLFHKSRKRSNCV